MTTEATALSPRPELLPPTAATLRRRGANASPRLDHETVSPTLSEATPRLGSLGPHRDDDILSPDLRDAGGIFHIRQVNEQMQHAPHPSLRPSYFQVPPTPLPAHNFPPSIPLPPVPTPPPIIVSSPSRTSAPLSRPPSSRSLRAKDLPRLPTPDFTEIRARPYKQALTSPLSFVRPEEQQQPQQQSWKGYLERLPSRWGWKAPEADVAPQDLARTESSGSSEGSSYSTTSSGSGGLLPPPHHFARKRESEAYYLKRGGHREGREEEPLSVVDDEEEDAGLLGPLSQHPRRRRDTLYHRFLEPPRPQARYPTLRSPNPNDAATPKVTTTLAAILPALQETSARFTQKFPWAAGGNDDHFAKLGGELGLSLSDDGGAFGMEGLRRWSGFKWALMVSVITVFSMGMVTLFFTLYTWFGAWSHAHVVMVVDYNTLIFATVAGGTLLLTSLLGISGTLLNSRPILAFYALLLWPSLVSVLIVGYTSYKRKTFSLDGKLNQGWSELWDDDGRAIIQNALACCGYYGSLHNSAYTTSCYPRSTLPGCIGPLYDWEALFLAKVYTVVFGSVPIHIANIFISLICSNHVNRTFGKGLTPKAYRLSLADVQANAEKIMLRMSATRMPYAPERLRGKKVKAWGDETENVR